MNLTHRRRPNGTVLLEILMAVFFTAAFFLLATQLTRTVFTQYRQIPIDEMNIRSSQGMLDLLHRDVWACVKVEMASPQSVKLTSNSGRTVSWSVDSEGTITRLDSTETTPAVLKEFAPGLTFAAQPAGLKVHWPVKGSTADVNFVSQVLLANGGGQ